MKGYRHYFWQEIKSVQNHLFLTKIILQEIIAVNDFKISRHLSSAEPSLISFESEWQLRKILIFSLKVSIIRRSEPYEFLTGYKCEEQTFLIFRWPAKIRKNAFNVETNDFWFRVRLGQLSLSFLLFLFQTSRGTYKIIIYGLDHFFHLIKNVKSFQVCERCCLILITL